MTACGRRYYEMTQVAETLDGLSIEPIITRATVAFFRRSVDLKPYKQFPDGPDSVESVAQFFNTRLG